MHTILIVEDDEDTRTIVKYLLETEGYRVFLAYDGVEALKLLGNMEPARPDLIILDWLLPQLDGANFLKRLQEKDKLRLNVLVFSALGCAVKEALVLGVRHFMGKPFNMDELLETIEIMIERATKKMEIVRA